jgi:hypothetical protein
VPGSSSFGWKSFIWLTCLFTLPIGDIKIFSRVGEVDRWGHGKSMGELCREASVADHVGELSHLFAGGLRR